MVVDTEKELHPYNVRHFYQFLRVGEAMVQEKMLGTLCLARRKTGRNPFEIGQNTTTFIENWARGPTWPLLP